MTQDARKLAELEAAASSPWCSLEVLLQYADALNAEAERVRSEAQLFTRSTTKTEALADEYPVDESRFRPKFRLTHGQKDKDDKVAKSAQYWMAIGNDDFLNLVADEMGRAAGEMYAEMRRELHRELNAIKKPMKDVR
jgi:hypothetical protein